MSATRRRKPERCREHLFTAQGKVRSAREFIPYQQRRSLAAGWRQQNLVTGLHLFIHHRATGRHRVAARRIHANVRVQGRSAYVHAGLAGLSFFLQLLAQCGDEVPFAKPGRCLAGLRASACIVFHGSFFQCIHFRHYIIRPWRNATRGRNESIAPAGAAAAERLLLRVITSQLATTAWPIFCRERSMGPAILHADDAVAIRIGATWRLASGPSRSLRWPLDFSVLQGAATTDRIRRHKRPFTLR